MKTENHTKLEQFWAHELGMESDLPKAPRLYCTVQHLYSGLQLFRKGDLVVVAVPLAKAEFVQDAIAGLSPNELFSVECLKHIFARDAERILGPAELNYADEISFRSGRHDSVRELSGSDSVGYHALIAALDSKEVEDSGVSAEVYPAFGAFSDKTLCAVASYAVWERSIAHISVATHPNYRRRGFAKAAVRSLALKAFDGGLILQWRALAWNENSLTLARDLGFEYYCSTIYVQLRESQ